jgi:excisionase family DNA binding protein
MSVTPCFLSVEEACKQLSISNSFFYLLVKRGQLGTVKLGRPTLMPFAELERLSSRPSSNAPDRTLHEDASTDIRHLVKAPKRILGMEKLHDQ